MTVRERIQKELQKVARQKFPKSLVAITIESAEQEEFGQYVSDVALLLGKEQKRSTSDIANELKGGLKLSFCKTVTVTPTGFLVFALTETFLQSLPRVIKQKRFAWSKSEIGKNKKMSVELLLLHPTGPLTIANGRQLIAGDVLCNVFSKMGYSVSREVYVDDEGDEADIFAESVLRKYFKRQGIPMNFPDYCYQGEFVDELAAKLHIPNYNLAKTNFKEVRDRVKERLLFSMLQTIKGTMKKKMHIRPGLFFSGKSLSAPNGPSERLWKALNDKNLCYEKDGDTWFKMSQSSAGKDCLLRKKDGETENFFKALAYQYHRLAAKKADIAVTLFNSNNPLEKIHLENAMAMLGFGGKSLELVIHGIQMSSDSDDAQEPGPKQATIEEVVAERAIDALRYAFLAKPINESFHFDPILAKEDDKKNPLYAIQYAHAQMCSILKKVRSEKRKFARSSAYSKKMIQLLAQLPQWPELLVECSQSHELCRITRFAEKLAQAFGELSKTEQVITNEGSVDRKMLSIIEALVIVFEDMFQVMGVSTSDQMS